MTTATSSPTSSASGSEKQRPIALVTGASSGIGSGFATELGRAGYDVVLVARRRDLLDSMATELRSLQAMRADIIEADLATDAGVSAIERRVAQGDIDLLVNNAGFGTQGEFEALPIARELQEIDLNVRAVVRLCHAVLPSMYERRSGAIINVASTGAFQPVPYMATYAATKAFVLHFSEALHEEAAAHGVTVTCLCPGPVKTGFQENAGLESSRLPSVGWVTVEDVVASALSSMRRGRAIAIPGALNRATAESASLMPRFITRKIAGAMFRNAGATKDN